LATKGHDYLGILAKTTMPSLRQPETFLAMMNGSLMTVDESHVAHRWEELKGKVRMDGS